MFHRFLPFGLLTTPAALGFGPIFGCIIFLAFGSAPGTPVLLISFLSFQFL